MQYNFFLNLKARNYTYIQKNCANIEIKTRKCLKSQFFIKIKIIMQKRLDFYRYAYIYSWIRNLCRHKTIFSH